MVTVRVVTFLWSYIIAFSDSHSSVNADEPANHISSQENRILIFNNTHTSNDANARVIGGTFAPIDEYPWFARATKKNNPNKWDWCGGSLVSPSFVLTAAHCVDDDVVKNGGYDVGSRCYGKADNDNDNCGQAGNEYRKASWLWTDPLYVKKTFDYDYALVLLETPITTIEPVAMNTNSALPKGGDDVIGMGFGATNAKGTKKSLRLLHVTVDALTNAACKEKWGDNAITDYMLCASRKGKDTCSGDSGGPLITKSKPYQLIGVSSWGGWRCAKMNSPGVYARVSSRYETLKQVICDNTPSSHPTASFCGPSDCPEDGVCAGNTTKLEIEMLTDQFGDADNFWYLKKGKNKILDVKNLNNSTAYEWCSCMPQGKYKFIIRDREGDGFTSPGYLTIRWNGESKLNLNEATGDWSKKKKTLKAN